MKVTGFDLRKSTVGSSVAYGRIVIEGVFEVEVSIMNGKNGLFVSWPSKRGKDSRWYPQFKVLDKDLNEKINDQVIYFYEQNIKGLPDPTPPAES